MRIHEYASATRAAINEASRGSNTMGNYDYSWWPVGVSMDLFQHRYYRINKILSIATGQWPYLSSRVRRCFLLVILLGLLSQLMPQIMAIVKYRHDSEFLLESLAPLLVVASLVIKLFCSVWNSQKMLKLLNRIRSDWQVWAHDQEVNIIHDYTERGRKMTILYSVTVVSTCILFATQPVVPKIIDVLLRNGSEPGKFAFPGYYYRIDEQKYYFYISIYSVMCITGAGIVTVAIDNMFIVYVQHGCGLFSAVGHKLQRTGKNEPSTITEDTAYASAKMDEEFEHLVWCLNQHISAIEYTKLIEATYTWSLFLLVGCNMLMTSITGFQILKTAKNTQESGKFVAVIVANVGHLYMDSWMSQTLMDSSANIRHCIHNGRWYKLSRVTQKFLIFMIMRCNDSCKLTAGKMLTMSIKSFVTILHASLSYFTLLRSV